MSNRTETQSTVEVVTSVKDLASYVADWQTLASNAVEPNVFYEPWQLLPAIAAFGAGKKFTFLFVYLGEGQRRGPLIGFFPFERASSFRGWPADLLTTWYHPFAPAGTPLLHRDFLRDAWRAALTWAREDARGASLVELPLLMADGPGQAALAEVCEAQRLRAFEVDHHRRAALHPSPEGAEAYLQAAISGGRRKEFRRQKRRLADLGRLTTRVLTPADDAETWINDFLALEASGWKGQARTSFLSDREAEGYFRAICEHAHDIGRLHMLALDLDDRPIAMKCNFLSGEGAYTFKIAFDEGYAKYSPGVLLELENIADAHRRDDIQWMDSCAIAGHPMIDGLWTERRAMRHLLISSGRAKGNLAIAMLPILRALKRYVHPLRRSPQC